MSERVVQQLTSYPKSVFGESSPAVGRMPDVVGWIEQHPSDFLVLLNKFDRVVTGFNTTATPPTDQVYKNTFLIKNILRGQSLPTIKELLEEPQHQSIAHYKRVVEDVKTSMDDEKTGYQHTQGNIEKLVIASIFCTYEEVVKVKAGFKDKKEFGQDYLVEALMETAAQDRTSANYELFTALANQLPMGMNWVNGYHRFSPEFRRMHEFD